jgi:hypothetical protein
MKLALVSQVSSLFIQISAGLGFHENADVIHLFITTLNDIQTANTTTKDIKKVVLDDEGSGFGCAIMSSFDNRQEMVVARNEAIYYYGLDGRGPCSIIDGTHLNSLSIQR